MPEFVTLPGLAPYAETLAAMEARVAAISAGTAPESIWLVEHPPIYTAGTSAQAADLTDPARFPVFSAGRGGQYTYHGPGQRVIYVMLDLNQRGRDVRQFVCALENWVIGTLATFNVRGERRSGRVGVWVTRPDMAPLSGIGEYGMLRPGAPAPGRLRTGAPGPASPTPGAPQTAHPGDAMREDKIAAIGVKLRRWVSFHGIAINVEPDLSHFSGIVPCGIRDHGVTSLVDLGLPVTMADLDAALIAEFPRHFPA